EPFNPVKPAANVTKVELTYGGTKYEIVRDKDDAPWAFTAPPALKGKRASDFAVGNVLGAFNRPMIQSIEREKATPAALQDFGLADPSARLTVTLTKDKKPTTHTYEVGKETDKGVYFKLAGNDTIYLASKQLLADARQDLRDLTIFGFKADDAVTLKVTRW